MEIKFEDYDDPESEYLDLVENSYIDSDIDYYVDEQSEIELGQQLSIFDLEDIELY